MCSGSYTQGESLVKGFEVQIAELCKQTPVWSPQALFSDEAFLSSVQSVCRIGDWLKPVVNVGASDDGRISHVVRNEPWGATLGRSFANRRSTSLDYRRSAFLASSGDLLVSRYFRTLVANVIPSEYCGLPIASGCQVYQCHGLQRDLSRVKFISVFFRSRVYQRYLRSRIRWDGWQDDVPNYIIPVVSGSVIRTVVELWEEASSKRQFYRKRMSQLSAIISSNYREKLGLDSSCADAASSVTWMPINQLLVFSTDRIFSGRGSILRNLSPVASIAAEGYLEGLLVCDFLPPQVSHFLQKQLPATFLRSQEIYLPIPEKVVQEELVRQCRDYLSEYRRVLQDWREMIWHDQATKFVDREVFHEN